MATFPHHADMVGSLLRPKRLSDARAEWREGKLPADELRPIEDEAITDVVAKEEAVGLPAVTDGEFRRDWWHLDFLAAIGGIGTAQRERPKDFQGEGESPPIPIVVGKVHLDAGVPAPIDASLGFFNATVLSLGAGLYEEIAFRVGLYGIGRRLVLAMMPEALPGQRLLVSLGWAALAAAVFSGWHYLGQFGEPFELRSFVFRWVCGIVFTLIYVFRGFAPVVWTHALYDIWVLAF